jgi:threonine aldolase
VTAPAIDLRSDTVTRPSPAMREAMARAEVGDDVYGEDPTVNRLQERVAALLGKAAALFVPSGSMANQVALKSHTNPGDEVLVGEGSHNLLYESGAAAVVSGVQLAVCGTGGLYSSPELEAAYKPDDHHRPPSRLVWVENTSNFGGGRVWPREQLAEVCGWARAHGLALHLDGARLWNVAVVRAHAGESSSIEAALREEAQAFDSVSVCLSKGLGAPVGSLVVGSREWVHRAHRWRKMMGGAMRQAGILAAAGLYALEHNLARLEEDHQNARLLADALAGAPGIAVRAPDSNIVLIDLATGGALDAATLCERARARGVLCGAVTPRRVRAVTHLDVERAAVARAGELLCAVLRDR